MPLPKGFNGFPEPQFTRTPNIIFDILLSELSGSQLKTLLFVVRKTMGWSRDHKMTPISIGQIQAATGLSNHAVVDALQYLCTENMILRQKTRGFEGRQGVTTYRLRFEGDAEEDLEIPECENYTLENANPLDSRVKKVDQKVHSGGDSNIIVFKETEIKEQNTTPSLSSSNSEPQNRPQNPDDSAAPTLERGGAIDFRTGEPIPPPANRKIKVRSGKQKPSREYSGEISESDRRRAERESRHNGAAAFARGPYFPQQIPGTGMYDPERPCGSNPVFTVRWNQLVPERPVDAGLLAQNPRSYREPVFVARFDEICQKAKELIAAGAILEFGFLLSIDKNTDQYRWQQLLAGQLEWMKPRAEKGKSKTIAADSERWAENIARKARGEAPK